MFKVSLGRVIPIKSVNSYIYILIDINIIFEMGSNMFLHVFTRKQVSK